MSTGPRLVFFVNRYARTGSAEAVLRVALERAPALVGQWRIVPFSTADDVRREFDRLRVDETPVAAGGDGTCMLLGHLCLLAAQGGRPMGPLGVVPLGTGNALAHALGVPHPAVALQALAVGATRPWDVLETTHPEAPVVLLTLSTGLESRLVGHLGGARGWRRFPALAAGLARDRRVSFDGIRLEVDGTPLVQPDEAVCNVGLYLTPCYAFGRLVLPDQAAGRAPFLGLVHRSLGSWLGALHHGVRTPGLAGAGDPCWHRGLHARLSTPWPVQVDGEAISAGGFEVTLRPGALLLFAAAGPCSGSP